MMEQAMTAASGTESYPQRVLTALGAVLGAAFIVFVLVAGVEVFLLAFAGLLWAILLRTPAEWLARRLPMPPGAWMAILLVLLLVLAGLSAWGFGAQMSRQTRELGQQLAQVAPKISEQAQRLPGGQVLQRLPQRLMKGAATIATKAAGALSATFGLLANLIFIFFLGIFFAASPGVYKEGLVRLFPPPRRARAAEVLSILWTSLQRWLLGKLLTMAFIGLLTGTGLVFLGVPMALALAVLAALLAFIPNIGPILSAVPAVLLGLAQGPETALGVALLYLGVQAVESYLLVPFVQKAAVELPPALLLLGQVFMALVFGLFGLILATPLMAALLVLIRQVYIGDVLGDRAYEH